QVTEIPGRAGRRRGIPPAPAQAYRRASLARCRRLRGRPDGRRRLDQARHADAIHEGAGVCASGRGSPQAQPGGAVSEVYEAARRGGFFRTPKSAEQLAAAIPDKTKIAKAATVTVRCRDCAGLRIAYVVQLEGAPALWCRPRERGAGWDLTW